MPFRDALGEIADVPCRLVAEGQSITTPLVTIAVPTFQRLEFLIQALRSVLAQRFHRPFEILVLDDDPASDVAPQLLERLPELRDRDFRYLVNERNLGLYPNHNRGIALARGEWIAFLNDDDLLEPHFLQAAFAVVDENPRVEAVMPRKIIFDERAGAFPPEAGRTAAWRMAKRILLESNFLGRAARPISAGKFFWGAVLGGSGGCLFRTGHLREIGGFYPEEHPASDLWLMARYAKLHGLHHARAETIRIRIAQNESAKLPTVKKGLYWGHKLQTSLIGTEVPRWYRHILPLLIAQHRAEFRDFWRAEVPVAELEKLLGMRIPRERRVLIRAVQTALRGF